MDGGLSLSSLSLLPPPPTCTSLLLLLVACMDDPPSGPVAVAIFALAAITAAFNIGAAEMVEDATAVTRPLDSLSPPLNPSRPPPNVPIPVPLPMGACTEAEEGGEGAGVPSPPPPPSHRLVSLPPPTLVWPFPSAARASACTRGAIRSLTPCSDGCIWSSTEEDGHS